MSTKNYSGSFLLDRRSIDSIIEAWKKDTHREKFFYYHVSDISESEIIRAMWDNNIIVSLSAYPENPHIRRVYFEEIVKDFNYEEF